MRLLESTGTAIGALRQLPLGDLHHRLDGSSPSAARRAP
jgi:hypothetical protein